MIHVVAKNTIKEDQVEQFLSVARKLVEATNKNDKGCIQYELYQDIQAPNVITIFEVWEDLDALKAHGTATHYTEAMALTKDYHQVQPQVNLYKKL